MSFADVGNLLIFAEIMNVQASKLQYMKRTFLLVMICIATGLQAMAQTIETATQAEDEIASNTSSAEVVLCPQTCSIVDSKKGPLMIFNGYCTENGYTNAKIGLKEAAVEDLIKMLKKYGKKAKEWAATAERENVTGFWKNLTPAMYKGVDVRYVQFDCGGVSIWKYYDNSLMSMVNASACAYFQVTQDGQSFFVVCVFCGNSDFKVQSGTSLVTTSVSGNHVSNSVTREQHEYNPGQLRFAIPTDELDAFTAQLNNAYLNFDKREKEQKNTKKLFK